MRTLAILAGLLWALPALAQTNNIPVFQSGLTTARHAPMFLTPGVIGDSGPAGGGAPGVGLSELGITNTGTPFCINDAPVTSLGGYHQFCLGANVLGNGAVISFNPFGGAAQLGMNVNLNGVNYPFPGAGSGNVLGPTSPTPTSGDLVVWNGGTTVRDGGPLPLNVTTFGADPTGSADNGTAFGNAFAAACGKSLAIPPGTYKFTTIPADPHCGVAVIADPNAILDFSAASSTGIMLQFSGSIGAGVALTGNVSLHATSITVANASTFCAPPTGISPIPGCSVFIRDDTQVNVVAGAGPRQNKGEIKQICGISGLTITLCSPTDDSYLVASNGLAQPVTMIGGLSWTGGQIIGLNADNGMVAMQPNFAYFPVFKDIVFKYFGQTGLLCNNCWAAFEDHDTYIGLGAITATHVNYASEETDAGSWGRHTNLQCFFGGPCFTLGHFSSPGYGVTRHMTVANSYAHYPQNTEDNQEFQTHFASDDFNVINTTTWFNNGSPTDINAISNGGATGTAIGNKVYNAGSEAIIFKNGTIYSGSALANDNYVQGTGASARCINFQQFVNTGVYVQITAVGNQLRSCQAQGIRYTGDLTGTNSASHINWSGNSVLTTDLCYYVQGPASRVTLVGNTCSGLTAASDVAAEIQDVFYSTVTGNTFDLPDSATGTALKFIGTTGSSPFASRFGMVSGNNFISSSDVSGTGVSVDNNSSHITIGPNQYSGVTTTISLGTGTGNAITQPLTGVSGSIGGGALGAGACATGTATVPGVTTAQTSSATAEPNTYPGDTIYWRARVTSNNTVTIYVCSATGSTPTSSTYNVTVPGVVNP